MMLVLLMMCEEDPHAWDGLLLLLPCLVEQVVLLAVLGMGEGVPGVGTLCTVEGVTLLCDDPLLFFGIHAGNRTRLSAVGRLPSAVGILKHTFTCCFCAYSQ